MWMKVYMKYKNGGILSAEKNNYSIIYHSNNN